MKKDLLENLQSIFEDHAEKDDNKSAAHLFKQGKYHLKEAYLYLLGVGDKNLGQVNQDIDESIVKRATEVSHEVRKLYDELEKLKSEK